MITKEEIHVLDNKVEVYTINNDEMSVSFMNYGGAILHMSLNDKKESENIAVAYEDMESYFGENSPFLNALIGPIAGRIQHGRYKTKNQEFSLPINNGLNHLHGGSKGLHRQFFRVETFDNEAHLTLLCKHDGFAGYFNYKIIYKLEGAEFSIDYSCTPSVRQVVNLTNHIYVNLDGNIKDGIEGHYLTLPTLKKVAIHKDGYPYKIVDIEEHSALDFTAAKKIGEAYVTGCDEFAYTKGIDAPFILEGGQVQVYSDKTNLELTISCDQEAIVVYTANYFEESQIYEGGYHGFEHAAIALETQAIPNGVNIDGASDSVHSVDEPFHQHASFTLRRR